MQFKRRGLKLDAYYNIKAQLSLAIYPKKAKKIQQSLGAPIKKLEKPLVFRDFKGIVAIIATYFIYFILEINGYLFNCLKFLILEINYNVLVRYQFFIKYCIGLFPITKSLV